MLKNCINELNSREYLPLYPFGLVKLNNNSDSNSESKSYIATWNEYTEKCNYTFTYNIVSGYLSNKKKYFSISIEVCILDKIDKCVTRYKINSYDLIYKSSKVIKNNLSINNLYCNDLFVEDELRNLFTYKKLKNIDKYIEKYTYTKKDKKNKKCKSSTICQIL